MHIHNPHPLGTDLDTRQRLQLGRISLCLSVCCVANVALMFFYLFVPLQSDCRHAFGGGGNSVYRNESLSLLVFCSWASAIEVHSWSQKWRNTFCSRFFFNSQQIAVPSRLVLYNNKTTTTIITILILIKETMDHKIKSGRQWMTKSMILIFIQEEEKQRQKYPSTDADADAGYRWWGMQIRQTDSLPVSENPIFPLFSGWRIARKSEMDLVFTLLHYYNTTV